MRRRGGLVRAAATTAVVAGTAGAVSPPSAAEVRPAGRGPGLRAAAGGRRSRPPPQQYAPPPAAAPAAPRWTRRWPSSRTSPASTPRASSRTRSSRPRRRRRSGSDPGLSRLTRGAGPVSLRRARPAPLHVRGATSRGRAPPGRPISSVAAGPALAARRHRSASTGSVSRTSQDGPPGRRDDAEERHDEEHPDDARDLAAGRDGHQHDRRVEADHPAVDDRRDEVALDDVEDDREDGHDHDVVRRRRSRP